MRSPIAQRILAIAVGYEALNDHLRQDPLMALFSGKAFERLDSLGLYSSCLASSQISANSHENKRELWMNEAVTSVTHRHRLALGTVLARPLCCLLVLPDSPAWAEILYDHGTCIA